MNVSEERAWKLLIELGARRTMIGGKHALDVSSIRVTSYDKMAMLAQSLTAVVGRSGANRRHVDRRGSPVYVVTDFYTLDRDTAVDIRAAEAAALKVRVRRVIDALQREDVLDGSRWIALPLPGDVVLPTATIGVDVEGKRLRWCDGLYDPRAGTPSRFGQDAVLSWHQLQGPCALIDAEDHP